jgi:hypothetical protein
MTEDELLQGITQALTLAGWRWTHIINSRGVTMGDPGLPDIIAVHPNRPGRVLCWELKGQNSRGDNGRPTYDQVWTRAPASMLDSSIRPTTTRRSATSSIRRSSTSADRSPNRPAP